MRFEAVDDTGEMFPDGTVVTATYDLASGTVSGWQARLPTGDKRNSTGLDTKASVFSHSNGLPLPDRIHIAGYVYICEGLSDTRACYEMLDSQGKLDDSLVIGAISSGVLPTVVASVDKLANSETTIVMVADIDKPGLSAAADAYANCRTATPKVLLVSEEYGADFDKVWRASTSGEAHGLADQIRTLVENPRLSIVGVDKENPHIELVRRMTQEAKEKRMRRDPVKRADYFGARDYSTPPLLVGAFGLRAGLVGAMVGPPASGKSAVALAACLEAANLPKGCEGQFAGEVLVGSDVLWIAAEGEHSIPSRVAAWQQKYAPHMYQRGSWPDQLGVITAYDSRKFGPGSDNEDMVELVLPAWCENENFQPKVIVLDTLAAALGNAGLDENSASGMDSAISWARLMIEKLKFDDEFGPAVLMVHHTGKDVERGARGHSSFHAALDIEVHVRNNSLQDKAFSNQAKVFFQKNRYGSAEDIKVFALAAGGYTDPQTGKPSGVRAEYLDI